MTTKITPRDWEALSAYLDGQLRPKERARIEKRMKENEALRSAFEELQHTRMLLRNQTSLQAPRNFTLTPEMVGARSRESRIPAAYPVSLFSGVLG